MGTKAPIQSDFASRVCCMDVLIPGRIHKMIPTTMTPNKRFSQSESSILLPQFFLLPLLYFTASDQIVIFCSMLIAAYAGLVEGSFMYSKY